MLVQKTSVAAILTTKLTPTSQHQVLYSPLAAFVLSAKYSMHNYVVIYCFFQTLVPPTPVLMVHPAT